MIGWEGYELSRRVTDRGFIFVDVMVGAGLLVLLLGFWQYTAVQEGLVCRMEHRLRGDYLLSEQLDMAELEGAYQREVEVEGVHYSLAVSTAIGASGETTLQGSCRWKELDREYTLTRTRLLAAFKEGRTDAETGR